MEQNPTEPHDGQIHELEARLAEIIEAAGGWAIALDARLLFPRVADAIEALPDGEREALLLFAWEDLSYQSVAEALELPIGTVRSRLNRARAHLRELLESKGENRVRSVPRARCLRSSTPSSALRAWQLDEYLT